MTFGSNRRKTDMSPDQIEAMISDEEDKKIRSILLVAQNLITAINAVTQLIQDVDDRFNAHKVAYDAKAARDERLIVQAQTVYKGITALLVVAQTVLAGLTIYGYQAFNVLSDRSVRTEARLEQILTSGIPKR